MATSKGQVVDVGQVGCDDVGSAPRCRRHRPSARVRAVLLLVLGWLLTGPAEALVQRVVGFADATMDPRPPKEQVILSGSGPFEVAGDPGDFAVAWIDGDEGRGHALSLALFGNGPTPRVRLLDDDVDPGVHFLLARGGERTLVLWPAAEGWLAALVTADGGDAFGLETDLVRLDLPGPPLALAVADGRAVIVVGSPTASLHELDLDSRESRVIHEFAETLRSASLARRGELWTLTAVEELTGTVQHTELDDAGRVRDFRVLGANLRSSPVISAGGASMGLVGWIEPAVTGDIAVLGLLETATGRTVATRALSSPGERTFALAAAGGEAPWVLWQGETAAGAVSRVEALDVDGEPLCSAIRVEDPDVTRTWLLADVDGAAVFRQRRSSEGGTRLSVESVVCSSGTTDTRADSSATSSVHLEATLQGVEEEGDGEICILSGVEDPCDGIDNDGDAQIDEGCDRICDAPETTGVQVVVHQENHPGVAAEKSSAWNGDGYGIAWSNHLAGTTDYQIYFAALDANGQKIGSEIDLTASAWESREPDLVWNGNGYGLVWIDDSRLRLARLDASGSRVGADTEWSFSGSAAPHLIWTGTEYAVVWVQTNEYGQSIQFQKVDAQGNLIGTHKFVTGESGQARSPSVAWNGNGFGIVYVHSVADELRMVRLDADGDPLGPASVVSDFADYYYLRTSLAWTGQEYGVAWLEEGPRVPDFGIDVFFARVDAQGAPIGSDLHLTTSRQAMDLSLAWTGEEYGLVWQDSVTGVSLVRIDASGARVGSDLPVATAALPSEPDLAWTGTSWGIVWRDWAGSFRRIMFSGITCCDDLDGDGFTECSADPNDADPTSYPGAPDPCDGRDNDGNGVVDDGCDGLCDAPERHGAEMRVTQGSGASSYPSLAFTGHEYGAAYRDGRTGNDRIYFARLDAAGQRIGNDRAITFHTAAVDDPSLVWTGSEYGLAWEDARDGNREIYFVRLDREGTKIGVDVRVTSDPAGSRDPSLVWGRNEYGLAWGDDRGLRSEVYFTRIDATGNRVVGDIAVTANDNHTSAAPSLVWTGSDWALTWYDARNLHNDIYFTRLDPRGLKTVPDARITTDPGSSVSPSLAPFGIGFGVAWHDNRHGDANYEIYFALVDGSGVKIGSDRRVTDSSGASYLPSLGVSGSPGLAEFGLSWYDDRWGHWDLFFARIDSNGDKVGFDLRLTTDPGHSWNPALLWNGNEYAVAWHDDRHGDTEIYFARVRCCDNVDGDGYTECGDPNDADADVNPDALETCDGRDNDGDGDADEGCDGDCDNAATWSEDTKVSANPGAASYASLAWNGSEYGVAWSDDRHGDTEIYFSRVDALGGKIGADVRVTDYASGSWTPSLAWNGSEYGIVWSDLRFTGGEIYFARLQPDGTPIGDEVRVTTAAGASVAPSLVWTGSEYAVAWQDDRDGSREIFLARLDPTGRRIGAEIQVTEQSGTLRAEDPVLAWSGTELGLVWEDNRNGDWEIYFQRIDPSGAPLGSDVRVTDQAGASWAPSIAWADGEWGIAWQEGRDGPFRTYFARLDASGTKIGADAPISDAASWAEEPVLVWTGAEYGVAWHDDRTSDWQVYFARISASGLPVGSEVFVTYLSGGSLYPSLAWNGTEYGVAWQDGRAAGPGIYFVPMSCCDDADGDGYTECANDGNDADPHSHPLAIERCDAADNNGDGAVDDACDSSCDAPEVLGAAATVSELAGSSIGPSLAFNGRGFGVVWADNRHDAGDLFFRRLDRAASPTGGDVRLTDAAGQSSAPCLVWNGTEYGVVWQDDRDESLEIYFARFDEDGNKLGTDVRVTRSLADSDTPSLVWNGAGWAVAWRDDRDSAYEIYFARLDPGGTRIGDDVRVTNNLFASQAPSLVWTGGGYGLAWQQGGIFANTIQFARLDEIGRLVSGPGAVSPEIDSPAEPSLAWTGSEYGVAYRDIRSGTNEIHFTRLDVGGVRIGADLQLSLTSGASSRPRLVWTGSQYGVSWHDVLGLFSSDIFFTTFDPVTGTVDPSLRLTDDTATSRETWLAWTGSEFALSWRDSASGTSETLVARLRCCDDADGDGTSECAGDANDRDAAIYPDAAESCDGRDNDGDGSLDEGCDTICDDPGRWDAETRVTADPAISWFPVLAWRGDGYGLVWEDWRDGAGEIYLGLLDGTGAELGDDRPVTGGGTGSLEAGLVWTGAEYGIVWEDHRDATSEIYLRRHDGAGVALGPEIRITNDGVDSRAPSVAWTGSEYGVVWDDDREGISKIWFARLDAAGNPIGLDLPVSTSGPATNPSVVWTGSEYGVVWEDNRDDGEELYFARLDAFGARIGAETRVTDRPGLGQRPSMAWTGSEYGIVWEEYGYLGEGLFFVRLDSSGAKIAPESFIISSSSSPEHASLVWNGSEYGLAWYDDWNVSMEVYFTRLDVSGATIEAEIDITAHPNVSALPSLVWNGSDYGLAWTDDRDGNYEIYFAPIRCCDDPDGDTWSECEDCDEDDPSIHPDADELCDLRDNDCDGAVDEDFPVPEPAQGLAFAPDRETMTWFGESVSDRYDVVRGDLQALRSSGGDFTSSVLDCLENDSADTATSDADVPQSGGSFYYVVRGQADCRDGTYDTGQPGQAGSRDAEIALSPGACP